MTAWETFARDAVEADGLWTLERGLPLGVRTADCVPILLAGLCAQGPWIAAPVTRIAALEVRCRRLLSPAAIGPAAGVTQLEFLLTGAALTALAFFVR